MKIFFTLLLTLIASYQCFSQVRYGIKSGMNVSSVYANNNTLNSLFEEQIKEPRIGYYLGVFLENEICDEFGFRSELLFSLKGFKSKTTKTSVETTTRYHYLNLPLLLFYRPIRKLSLLAGPELGFLIRAGGKTDEWDSYDNFTSASKRTDFGIAVGMNYNVISKLALEVRYSYGLAHSLPYKGITQMENRAVQLGLSYNILK